MQVACELWHGYYMSFRDRSSRFSTSAQVAWVMLNASDILRLNPALGTKMLLEPEVVGHDVVCSYRDRYLRRNTCRAWKDERRDEWRFGVLQDATLLARGSRPIPKVSEAWTSVACFGICRASRLRHFAQSRWIRN